MTANAREFAIAAHGGQLYGAEPYVTHLDQVVALLQEFNCQGRPGIGTAAAFLHDVLEDTPVSRDQLQDAFGEPTTRLVEFCTDEPGTNRRTRKQLTYARLRKEIDLRLACPDEALWEGIAIKLADRLANLRSSRNHNPGLLQMYRKEREAFRDALRVPKQYLTAPMQAMWNEYDRLLEGDAP